MTAPSNHPGHVIPQDIVPQDGWGDVLNALPITEDEINELLYGDDRPHEERIQRLDELAGILRAQQAGDLADGDPAGLLAEIKEAVARLRGAGERDPELAYDEPSMDEDPLSHRETLSPDSDELEDIEESDEASLTDDTEPLDDDDLDPEDFAEDQSDVTRGVR